MMVAKAIGEGSPYSLGFPAVLVIAGQLFLLPSALPGYQVPRMNFLPECACFLLITSTLAKRAASAQTQHEMNAAAAAEFAKADQELQ